jgi:pimeloyl-ACP methyl ester carboxylesterase
MEIKGYSTLWQAIIRPPRFQYDLKDLGPQEFYLETIKVVRTDLELKN